MRFLREPHAPPPRPTPVIPEPHSTCDWATGPWPPTHTGCWLSCRHPSRHCRPGPHRLPGESRGCWTSPCRPGSRCCLLPELPGAYCPEYNTHTPPRPPLPRQDSNGAPHQPPPLTTDHPCAWPVNAPLWALLPPSRTSGHWPGVYAPRWGRRLTPRSPYMQGCGYAPGPGPRR